MPELNTKNLSELDEITELGDNDKILVESNGRMKKLTEISFGGEGGGVYILDISDYVPGGGGGVG